MSAFIARRLVESALVLLVVSFVVYALIGLMPGDPIDLMLQADPSLTSADAARLKALQGLDRPLVERWVGWLGRALQGDFGYSRLYAVPAIQVLGGRLVNTLLLMGISFVLALALAVPAGIWAAARPGSAFDRAGEPRGVRRLLGPGILARAAADHPVRGRARLAAGGRHDQRRRRRAARPAALSDAAGADADPADRRRVPALRARGDAGDPARAVHPDRAGAGRAARAACCCGTRCATPCCR